MFKILHKSKFALQSVCWAMLLSIWAFHRVVDCKVGEWKRNKQKPPNIILLLADDVGYGDLQSYGHPTQEAGGVERMVKEGMKFTQWYSPSMACSPSRVATLTGRYAVRSGFFGPGPLVFIPSSPGGIPRKEITIAESLKSLGYVNGMMGKWHLGINKENKTDGYHLPKHHGFDFVGTIMPFTNVEMCNPEVFSVEEMAPNCFLYNDTTIIEQPINFKTLTERMVDDAKYFLSANRDQSFFMFFSFIQTHAALFCSPPFCGKSRRGFYGDNVNEMSAAVSTILNYLDILEIAENTLVIFVSDNGPKVDGCPHGGDSGPFKGGKGLTWEGGLRVPAVARWPGVIHPGSISHSVISSLDLYPTLLKMAANHDKLTLPTSHLDGRPIKEIFCKTFKNIIDKSTLCQESESPRILFHYAAEEIFAVRYGNLKVHYKTKLSPVINNCLRPSITDLTVTYSHLVGVTEHDPPLLFNLAEDPREDIPLNASLYKDELKRIWNIVEKHKKSIPEAPPQLLPIKPELSPCCNPPYCMCNYV